MKKNVISTCLVSLLSVFMIAGCDNTSNNSSSSSSTKETADVMKYLNKYKDGVKFDISVNQTYDFLDGYFGNFTNITETHSISAEIVFQGGENKGFSSTVVDSYVDGFAYNPVNMKVFEGEDGYAYFDELDYENKVNSYALSNGDSYINYNYYCLNPFTVLLDEDFKKIDDTHYSLNKSKSAIFASYILGDIDEAYFGVIDKCIFNIEGEVLKSISVVPHRAHRQLTVGYDNLYYFLEQEATLNVVAGGSDVKVDKVTPNPIKEGHEDEIARLQTALNNLEDDNYTLSLDTTFNISKIEEVEEGQEKEVAHAYNYAKYYYTGEDLYYSVSQEDNSFAAPNADNDVLLKKVQGNSKLLAYGYSENESVDTPVFTRAAGSNFSAINNVVTYDEIAPKLNEVNAAIFNYNEEKGCYSICEELMPYIATIAIVPPLTTFTEYLYEYGSGMDIYLTADGVMDYVEFKYLYHDGFSYQEGVSVMTFTDIGSTVLPFNLTVK